MDSTRTPVLKYKIYCHDEEWLPKGEGNGINLWKEDLFEKNLLEQFRRQVFMASWNTGCKRLETMRHLPEVVKGLSGFIGH